MRCRSRCLGVLLIALCSVWADPPQVEVRADEIWLIHDGHERQLTHDGKGKTQGILSPSTDRIAYIEDCHEAENCPPLIVIIDTEGRRQDSFPLMGGKEETAGPCASILWISWPADEILAGGCHINPSLGEYVEIRLPTHKIVRDFLGFEFQRSPDGAHVAHVGWIVHFAPPYAQSYYLQFDDVTVYPLPKGVRPVREQGLNSPPEVVVYREPTWYGIHEFHSGFAWSPDSQRVAFVDCTYDYTERPDVAIGSGCPLGDETARRCALAVVSRTGRHSLFPLAGDPTEGANRATLTWDDARHVVMHTGRGARRFALP